MSISDIFEITIPNDIQIKFEQDETFENFVSQFQQHCRKLLCVINGSNLKIL